MRSSRPFFLSVLSIAVAVSALIMMPSTHAADEEHEGESHDTKANAMQPVEADMHEFMEYAFEPFFHELKESMAESPKDKKAWKPVKANSLILAENGNLLMLRGPDEKKSEWNKIAADLRDQGKLLYQAAKKRDYAVARKEYVTFVAKCNVCHEKFAEGEHMQKP